MIMTHEIHRVTRFRITGPAQIELLFEDGTCRSVSLAGVVGRGLYAPLADPSYFARVSLDEDFGTLVWPNGADFDPAQLYDWDRYGPAMERLAASWSAP